MTVKTLIQKLEKYNPEATVRLNDSRGEELLFVLGIVGDNDNIWLESESDCDMGEEIQTRFNDAIANGLDELDVYSDMLETGINVDMVCRYMGDETANHMQKFCEEHGLI